MPRGGGCSSINPSREPRLGRGDPRFTADRTAFVVIRGTAPTGARAIFCIETKNSGAGHDPALPPHPRHQEIGRTTTGLSIAPESPALTGPASPAQGFESRAPSPLRFHAQTASSTTGELYSSARPRQPPLAHRCVRPAASGDGTDPSPLDQKDRISARRSSSS
ncbi:hypothetical protein [Methylobacterium sp. D48H]